MYHAELLYHSISLNCFLMEINVCYAYVTRKMCVCVRVCVCARAHDTAKTISLINLVLFSSEIFCSALIFSSDEHS